MTIFRHELESDQERAIFDAGREHGVAETVAGLLLQEVEMDHAVQFYEDYTDGMLQLRGTQEDAAEGGDAAAESPG